jgi:rhodanese-related sulfurtransferase
MRAERVSTIGTERLTNYALQIKSREEFVKQLTSNLPARPAYFLQDAEMNRTGAAALSDLPELSPLTPAEVQTILSEGGIVLDVRPGEQFAAGHVPGSVNIALSGQFASWAGSLLGLGASPVLIAESQDEVSEARMRLARVGLEDARGFLSGGIEAWTQSGFPLAAITQIDVQELDRKLQGNGTQILDVRREPEWEAGHIVGASWWPLDNFKIAPPEIDRDLPLAVHCKGGYRSMIACSLLQRAGFQNVVNVSGGFDAWQQAKLPVVIEKPVEA